MSVDPHALAHALDAPPPQFLATDAFGVVSWVIHKRQHAAPLVGTPEFDALWGAHPDTFLTFRPPGKSDLVPYPRWTQAYGATYGFAGQVARALPLNAAPAIVGEAAREWTDRLAAHRREPADELVRTAAQLLALAGAEAAPQRPTDRRQLAGGRRRRPPGAAGLAAPGRPLADRRDGRT